MRKDPTKWKSLPGPTKKAYEAVREHFRDTFGYDAPDIEQREAFFGLEHPDWPGRRFPVLLVKDDKGAPIACYSAIGDHAGYMEDFGPVAKH